MTGFDLPAMDGVQHHFIELPGLRMHVAEAGAGETVLLLHGFPQHWWEWREVIPELAGHYRVICPDLRGFGWTGAPPTGYTSDQFVSDVVALLDVLDVDRVHVIGHDWGSLVAFQLCLSKPERVRTHLCLSVPPPYISFDPALVKVMWRLWFDFVLPVPLLGPWALRRTSLARFLLTNSATGGRSGWMPEDVELFAGQFRDPARAHAGSALYRSFILPTSMRMMRGTPDTRLTTRTRVLLGADDPIVRAEFIHGHEPHVDDLTIEHVADAGHFLVDDQPKAVVEHALDLFRHPPASPA
ncbi:alpha/beta fold hydrolase [Kribbella deserti]|uniref:Alpha/beta fold hydrolase n=1 Tax=Kribbella deserti TaxID=1926257 RepID=A0ABV6QCY8_9ACTN